jgi:hypothetical protein
VELTVIIIIVRAEVPRRQPRRLSIGHKRQFARSKRLDRFCLAADSPYLEARILRTLKNLESVKSEEYISGVLPS